MANETPPNKGEQVKGGPPIIENAQLPRMGTQAMPPKLINGAVRHMTVGAQPAQGSNLMAPVPKDQMPQQGAGGKPTYPAQERKTMEQPAPGQGYIRLHVRVTNGQLSVIGAQAVAGPLVQNQGLHHDYSYEVTVGANRVAAESFPNPAEWRSYPNPHGGPGQEGHHITHAANYDLTVRIPQQALSLAQLPQMQIALYQVSENAQHKPLGTQVLNAQFSQQVREVARLNGLHIEQLPAPVQESLRKALQ